MRQLVLLEAADLAVLKAGKTLTLSVGGNTLDVALERPGRRASTADTDTSASSNGAAPRVTLSNQRGDCPYCAAKGVLLTGHVRQKHPGKAIPYLGAGGVVCSACRRKFPSAPSLSRHLWQVHGRKKKAAHV